ncbi:hypothetical protein FACS1894123_00020 [Bacteroidia bacterium]|nr:hypothetical protein FACS1894123_00020 [Bacteroidia bacterium]
MSEIVDKIDIVRLEEDTPVSSFDCGDMDLNDFLLNDAKNYLKAMLAITYLVKIEGEIAAYFCLSYDSLTRTTILTEEEKALWNKVGRKIPNSKRHRNRRKPPLLGEQSQKVDCSRACIGGGNVHAGHKNTVHQWRSSAQRNAQHCKEVRCNITKHLFIK